MKLLKQITGSIVALSLMAAMLPINSIAKAEENNYTVLLNEDFENPSSDNEYGTLTLSGGERKNAPNGDGMAAKINIVGVDKRAVTYELNEPISKGTIYIGYDQCWEKFGNIMDIYISSIKKASPFGDAMGIRFDSGSLLIMSMLDSANWGSTSGGHKVKAGEWHKVETWLDYDAKVAEFYLDGVLLASTNIGENLPDFVGWGRSSRFATVKDGSEYIDNLSIVHIKEHNARTVVKGASSIPTHWKTFSTLSVSTEALAGTFFSEEAKIRVLAQNLLGNEISGDLKLRVTDEMGNVVCDDVHNISIEPSGKKQEEFTFNLPRFGYYDVHVSLENNDFAAEGFLNSEAKYTICRVKESSVQNQKLGFSTHSSWGHGMAEQDRWNEVLSKAGFSISRDAVYWVHVQKKPGSVIELRDDHKAFLKIAYENDIGMLLQLAGSEGTHSANYFPETDEELSNFYTYVYETIKLVKEINPKTKYVEFYNEYANQDPKVATRMQKTGYEAAKAADPEIIVIGGATARFPLEFIESLLKEGFGNYIDAFSGHPYTSEVKPEDTTFKHGTAMEQILSARELLDRYGHEDVDIILSELSYTAFAACETEVDQASYGLRQYIMVSPMVEEYIWYNAINKKGTGTASEFEGNYGLLKSWARETGVPYQAKPVTLAFGAYNDLLAQGENLGRVETDDEDVYIYKFKTRNNEDVIAVWNWLDEIETIGLDLGIKNAELYDMYGNKTDITADENGIFNVAISGELTYIKGDFDKIDKKESRFKQPYTEFDVCMGENYSIQHELPQVEGAVIEVEADSNFDITKADFNSIEFKSGYSKPENSEIKVMVKKDGRVLYQYEIVVTYVEPVIYKGVLKPYNTGRYIYEMDITNERQVEISTTFTITEPASLAGKTYHINKIVGNDTRKLKINIPQADTNKEKLAISGVLKVIADGEAEEIPVKDSHFVGCIKYTDKKPVIDGKIELNEWDTFLPIRMDKESMTQRLQWGGVDDLSAEAYTMCDDEFLYLGVVVKDDIHYDKDTPVRVWNNDSVQFAVATDRKVGARNSEFGLGLSNGEVTLQRYTSQAINDGVIEVEFDKETEYAVKRYENEKKTVYELKIKLSDVYAVVPNMKNLKKVVFAICVNEHDGDSRGWMEYTGGGIAGTKSPVFYMDLPVYGN